MSIEAGSFPSLIFPVHLEQVARIGIEVKGGSYRLEGGEWRLPTAGGWESRPSPRTQLWDATMELKDTLGERLNHPAVTRT